MPHFDFSKLRNASEALTRAAADYARSSKAALAAAPEKRPAPATWKAVNAILLSVERAFTRPEGLPRRAWFTHHLYAPGFYTGYAVKTLPAVREAIEERKFSDVDREAERAAEAIQNAAAKIREAARLLQTP